jgi:hypothetical protein
MIDAGLDHLAPIGNIHLMLESGPPKAPISWIYPASGHFAFGYRSERGAASFRRPKEKLSTDSPVHE